MPRLLVVVASTRPNRVGEPVGAWFAARAEAHGGFAVDVADLAALDLPFLDEPEHPRLGRYERAHTREWSARVDAADAVVLVMPEYNHGFTAPLKNALDFLSAEWAHKPVGFVSYGGVSGGLRAVQMLEPVLVALRMAPVAPAVTIPFVRNHLTAGGDFAATEPLEQAADAMLDELGRIDRALRPLRAGLAATAA